MLGPCFIRLSAPSCWRPNFARTLLIFSAYPCDSQAMCNLITGHEGHSLHGTRQSENVRCGCGDVSNTAYWQITG
eukprot:4877245-Pleurochrysis_carterae.AAC.2